MFHFILNDRCLVVLKWQPHTTGPNRKGQGKGAGTHTRACDILQQTVLSVLLAEDQLTTSSE